MTRRIQTLFPLASLTAALCLLTACGDDDSGSDDAAASETGETDGETDGETGADGGDPDGDPGQEPPPGDGGEELCDAGDEAWVQQVLPLIQGRKPESGREVKLLASMVQQLDAAGQDGRAVVARRPVRTAAPRRARGNSCGSRCSPR